MKTARKAPDALKILWGEKFFLEGKTKKEVEAALHKKGYNFGDTLRKALESADFLLPQCNGEEKKFIQRYPFIEEDVNGRSKTK